MNCFNHTSSSAIGVCKACQKGLCAECAVDVGLGIACKGACETNVIEINEMTERSLKIYGIGKYESRVPATGVLLWGSLAVILWLIFFFVRYKTGSTNFEIAVPAFILTLIAAFAFYSSRRSGIKNC